MEFNIGDCIKFKTISLKSNKYVNETGYILKIRPDGYLVGNCFVEQDKIAECFTDKKHQLTRLSIVSREELITDIVSNINC